MTGIETNWCVITGAPSSGKTTVIDALAKLGYATEPEVARDLIEECLRRGHSLEEVRSRNDWLQNEILRQKLAREKAQDPKALVFLDRGIPDSLSYFRLAGMDLAPALAASAVFRYRAVFIFDRLPLVRDGVRGESEALAVTLDRALECDYTDLGYAPVRVPVMTVGERIDFILENLGLKSQ